MFTQLNPPIPLTVLDKGDGFAIAVIDYGQEHNLIWVTMITATGEILCAKPQGPRHSELDDGSAPSCSGQCTLGADR